jgi:preprotein translocase subunit SecA
MDVLRGGVNLRSYAQIDPKNEFKKEGFEKFQLLKMEIADQVSNFLFKQEATDTIRDLITGRLRQQPPPPPPNAMQVPRSPQEVQALFESLVAAGQVPQEVLDRMAKGERFVIQVTPQGLVLRPAAPAAPGTGGSTQPAAAASAVAEKTAAGDHAAAGPERETAATPTSAPAATASASMPAAAAAGPAAKRTATRPPNTPKPGRNDPCPCGSGIKYKKCCAPAFD